MQRRVLLTALLLDSSAVVLGSKCAAGNKHKADLTSKFCSTSATDAASCDATCCEANKETCGGLGVTCPFGTYAANDAAWKNKKTTAKTKTADCCAPTATCDNTLYSCPAGYKKTTNAQAKKTKCPSGPKSCGVVGACCEADTKTCGGFKSQAASQPTSNTAGAKCAVPADYEEVILAKTDDAWKKMAISQPPDNTKFEKECCIPKATCSALTCKAGFKAVAANKNKVPVTGTLGNYEGDSNGAGGTYTAAQACCEKDAAKTTCGTLTVTCSAGTYAPASYSHVLATAANANTKCCAPVATCAAAVCPSGYKMKTNVATLSCTGDHLSCGLPSTKCCEVDKTTCGGIAASTGITCAYGFYDESSAWILSGDGKTSQAVKDAWNKRPATEATKNKDCCTAAAECKVEIGTTTPGPVVTTTPVVPI